jgi:hypothetical protein
MTLWIVKVLEMDIPGTFKTLKYQARLKGIYTLFFTSKRAQSVSITKMNWLMLYDPLKSSGNYMPQPS